MCVFVCHSQSPRMLFLFPAASTNELLMRHMCIIYSDKLFRPLITCTVTTPKSVPTTTIATISQQYHISISQHTHTAHIERWRTWILYNHFQGIELSMSVLSFRSKSKLYLNLAQLIDHIYYIFIYSRLAPLGPITSPRYRMERVPVQRTAYTRTKHCDDGFCRPEKHEYPNTHTHSVALRMPWNNVGIRARTCQIFYHFSAPVININRFMKVCSGVSFKVCARIAIHHHPPVSIVGGWWWRRWWWWWCVQFHIYFCIYERTPRYYSQHLCMSSVYYTQYIRFKWGMKEKLFKRNVE